VGPGRSIALAAAVVVAVAGMGFAGRAFAPARVVALHDPATAVVRSDVIGIDVGRGYVDPTVPVAVTIPPPRWLVPRLRPSTERITSRQGGLGWQTDPYAE
jgi:hypothetical protein